VIGHDDALAGNHLMLQCLQVPLRDITFSQ
jgi:hypothetical protein